MNKRLTRKIFISKNKSKIYIKKKTKEEDRIKDKKDSKGKTNK